MVASITAITGVIFALRGQVPVFSTGVLYLLAVLLVSSYWGRWMGPLTSVLSAAAFNWFRVPTGRFSIARLRTRSRSASTWSQPSSPPHSARRLDSRAEEAEREREAADRARAELEELSRERERMQGEVIEAEALRRSDELKTALLRSVSHDLRTPLTSVIAAGAALDSPNLTEAERTELSEAVVGEGQRLSRLVENLLDVSRLETGNAEPHREQVDLGEVLEAARDSLGLDRDGFRISGEAGLPTLRADPAQLERAFANLIENGVRHSGGRPVLADCRMVEGRVIVRVVDQGPGIPESAWERIFEPFYRANSVASGSGLGLAIAKGFVEANGGTIAIESLPGQGSAFVVSFDGTAGDGP